MYMLTNDTEDLTGKTSIKATVKTSEEGLAKAKFFIKTGDGWTWFDGGMEHVLVSEDGTEITILLDGLTNPSEVKEFGIQFIPEAEASANCTVYVDNIVIK